MRIVSAFKHADVASLVVYCASNAVKKYVEERHKWPALWENLESISTTTDTDLVPPGGWDETRTYVEINFNLTLDEVANQQFDRFSAIKPIGPVWADYPPFFIPLLETVRKARDAHGGTRRGDAAKEENRRKATR